MDYDITYEVRCRVEFDGKVFYGFGDSKVDALNDAKKDIKKYKVEKEAVDYAIQQRIANYRKRHDDFKKEIKEVYE